MNQPIPLVDLRAAHAEIAADVREDFERALADAAFIGGQQVGAFEKEYAAFCGVRHCIGLGNGTDALEFALRATQVRPGDEVILPANTFIATAEAVVRAGATPVLVDVDPDTLLIDPDRITGALTTRTRAVVPVHLYGRMVDVSEVARAVEGRPVVIVEDAAQSQGAVRNGVASGAAGLIAATSFYPGKNLGAAGDAGAVTTDDEDLARSVRLLGNHGSEIKYVHDTLGFNSRLDALQAIVLRHKLLRLPDWNAARRRAAVGYTELLADLAKVSPPSPALADEHVWHLYVVRVPNRDRVLDHLLNRQIGAAIHYPVPVHLTGAFGGLADVGSLPVAEAAAQEVLSLPMHPHLTTGEQERVAEALREVLD